MKRNEQFFYRNFKDETSMLLLIFLVHMALFHRALFTRNVCCLLSILKEAQVGQIARRQGQSLQLAMTRNDSDQTVV
jgi:hypothetical protein